ncbi:polysaccharide biosynthesis protein [Pseudaminobacter sp. NGMCC 1.201702]|uniref:polysaccharide biosynthesis protein n=1 Tax=Pseudaminobacter sp. NGMCC 1.201702 TaxID=3391825 RepID=UPI0039EE0D42
MLNFFKARRHNILRLGSVTLDLLIASGAFFAAYGSAYGFERLASVPGLQEKTAAFTVVCCICFIIFGVSRGSWRYVSISDLLAVIKAVVVAVSIYTISAFLVSRGQNVPRSVPIFSALFLITGLSAVRLAYRLFMDVSWKDMKPGVSASLKSRKVLLLGITHSAEGFIRSVRRNSDSDVSVVGIFDDNQAKHSRLIHGVKVIGGLADVRNYVERLDRRGIKISELIVTENRPSRQRLSDILETAAGVGMKVTRIPDMTTTSSITSDHLLKPKPIELEDLLGRPEVCADLGGIAQLISGRIVLATGAGGSIGSELCRQIAGFNPRQLIITDNSEFHIYLLDKHLRQTHPHLPIITQIVNVREPNRVADVFGKYKPEVVFHAAALKHVPLVEDNPIEGIKTNVLGTRNVADAALANKAHAFIMISTDKAVNPTNVMGATKRAAEAYCQSLDVSSNTTSFKTVRFGNVLGSNGSVVPRFQEQIAAGGPVTVTHPHIVRFFMTIPEAVRLVLHASAQALRDQNERGKIMVLDMGKPVRIVDLAERMIQLAGYKPHVDIEISYVGLRPGEKLFEELFDPSEVQDGKTEDGYVIASPRFIDKTLLHNILSGLEAAVEREDAKRAVELLSHVVPEYVQEVEPNLPDAIGEAAAEVES